MFDDPGKKLNKLRDELLEAEPIENLAQTFDEALYDDEEFDESDAVLASEGRRPGLRTLVLLALVAGAVAAARWLGWI